MSATLSLLIIDESSNDAEMLTNILRNAGHAVRAKRVEDAEDFEEALGEQAWEIILSADKLTYYEFKESLNILKQAGKDIPVIVMANSLDNIDSAMAMNAGARDLVMKNEPAHLQQIVARELQDLKNRRELRVSRKSLRESENRCRTLLDSSRDAITYVHEGMHIYANQVYMETFGYTDQEEIESMPIMDMVSPEDHDKFKQFLRKFSNNEDEMQGEIEVHGRRYDDSEFKAVMEFTPASIDGEACTQIIIRSQSDQELEKKLQALSKKDLVTGLYNRQYFLEMLENCIAQAAAESDNSALAFISLDNFDDIRTKVGIAASDLVLGDYGKHLSELIEEPDIIARFDDRTFSVLLHGKSSAEAMKVAESMRKTVESTISETAGQSVTTTASIGISLINENSPGSQELLARAETARDLAVDANGNCCHLHNIVEDEQATIQHNEQWREKIKNALSENGFYFVYQPIVSLHGDPTANYEVLLRMRGNENKEILPNQFLNAAEQTELLPDIDRWVIENTLKVINAEKDKGKESNFFIKLSNESLNDAELLPWLSEQLKTYRVTGNNIVFQIHEAGAMMQLTNTKKLITGLKQLHCRIVLEHFGTGLNSMKTLKHLDVDILKIDGSLIQSLSDDTENQERVKEITQTAHSIGKLTIAEFVQDANSLAVLWQCGVNYIQGYFLQEPSLSLDYDFTSDN